jgi:predicted unusual protein kinase regulating ubiquinone biosynthesis (AarF/ABC1/UbiB family)
MADTKDDLKAALIQRLLGTHEAVPTSALGRLGRTAGAALRSGRLLLGARHAGEGEAPLELEALAKIVGSLGELKGIAMKAGQILSYVDVALPEELRMALSVLQTHAQPMPTEQVRRILQVELGARAHELLATLEEKPIAAASIGQVHRARLADGTQVAVKVQYPEIDRAIEADFGPAAAGTRLASLFSPGAKVDSLVREARERFLEECDYLHEAHCQRRFAGLLEGHPVLRVPAVHEAFCTRRVLTTAFMEGEGLEVFLMRNPSPEVRDRLGQALFEFYVGALFRHQLYNCDPHPGNYLFQAEGTVGVLDYGCTREFEPAFVRKLAALTRAVHRDTREALHASFVELGLVREGQRYDFETARGLVRAFYGPMLRDEVQGIDLGEARGMRQVLDSKRHLMKLTLPGEFLFLFRIRFGLMSVLARLGARANWYRLEEEYVAAAS